MLQIAYCQRLLQILEEDWQAYVARGPASRVGAADLHHGRVDSALVLKLLSKIPDDERSHVEAILGASHRWSSKQVSKYKSVSLENHVCQLCGEPSEGPEHTWLRCSHPALQELRRSQQGFGQCSFARATVLP